MPYRILCVGTTDTWASDPVTLLPLEASDGIEAKRLQQLATSWNPSIKWRVKRVVDLKWRSREQRKFEIGRYKVLPWNNEEWWRANEAYSIHKLHYAHPSLKEPGMISFVATSEDGMDNKHTRIKVGRYLEKFTGVLSDYGRSKKDLIENFSSLYEPRQLYFAETEDMVQWVYEHGPNSCMSSKKYREHHGWGFNSAGGWPLDMHAARVYIAGDLQVAYITRNDKPKGPILGRSVIWPAKKTFSRCYGDEHRLKSALLSDGYKFAPNIGAKIQRIPIPGHQLFVAPYIDAGEESGGGALAVTDANTHLVISLVGPGTYPANTTSGASGRLLDKKGRPVDDTPNVCQYCAEEPEYGEMRRVYISSSAGDFHWWCSECINANAFYTPTEDRFYRSSTIPHITMTNGEVWRIQFFERNGFICDATGGRYNRSQMVQMDNGARWVDFYFEDHGFRCDWSGNPFPNEERVELADGHVISCQAFYRHGFQCTDCGRNLLLSDRHGRTNEQPQCVRCHTDAVANNMANDDVNRQPTIERTEEHHHE